MLAIGIDIGGTKILASVINEDGNILYTKEQKTSSYKGKDYIIERIIYAVEEILKQYKIDVIGIGSAGRVNYKKGKIYYATSNLPDWTGLELKKIIQSRTNILTVVDNDVNVAGIGEGWLGAGKGYSSFLCITLGTGIAAALFHEGKIVRGNRWSAGEIGHMILYPNGRKCNCGQRGCFEQYCSGTALFKIYNDMTNCDKKLTSGKEFFQLVKNKDINSLKVLKEFTNNLAIAIVSLCNIIDPEIFILGGGLIDTKEFWWDEMLAKIDEYSNPAVSHPLIKPATFRNKAGIIGAAKLGFDFIK